MPRRAVRVALLICVGCGPRVVEPPASDGTGSDDADPGTSAGPATAEGEDEGSSSSGAVYDEGSGSAEGVCGDGILDVGEACDDGNLVDADGCSQQCEVSGTSAWQVDLSPSRGIGVGLDVREGHAFVLVQDYGDGSPKNVEATSGHFSQSGQLAASFEHLGALADPDLVRDPIASTAEGHLIFGYPSPDGALGRIELGSGIAWVDPMDTWRYSAATRWIDGEVYTLRMSADTDSFAVLTFTDTGDPIDTLWLDEIAFGTWPLPVGAMFVRGPSRPIVFMKEPEGPVQMHSFLAGEWLVDPVPVGTDDTPRAFLHGAEIVVWSETDRIVVDMLDHVQPPTPRVVPGFVLTSFAGGFVILEGQRIDVYDDAGALRWSHESTAVPRLAMPDGLGGMFVLADLGYEQGVVTLERLVL